MVRKIFVCVDQRDALRWMNLKNVPGFPDEVVDTFIRKVQGDPALIDEVAEAYMNPTSAQALMQAGSSKVAKLPKNIALVNPAVNAAGADAMVKPLLDFMKEQREADEKREDKRREADEKREEKKRQADKEERQEREKFMAKLMDEQAEQLNKRDDKQNKFLLAMVETLKDDRDNKRAAANDGKSQAEPDQKRPKPASGLLGIKDTKQEAKDWLHKNIGKFIKPVANPKKRGNAPGVIPFFTLIGLQMALANNDTFFNLCDMRKVKCSCLHHCIKRVYPNIQFCHIDEDGDSVHLGAFNYSLDINVLYKL